MMNINMSGFIDTLTQYNVYRSRYESDFIDTQLNTRSVVVDMRVRLWIPNSNTLESGFIGRSNNMKKSGFIDTQLEYVDA
jgi:hypothetical protein